MSFSSLALSKMVDFKVYFWSMFGPGLPMGMCLHFSGWNLTIKHIDIIENVQRQPTKQLSGFKELSYSERLKRLKLPILSFRRERGDMIDCNKGCKIMEQFTRGDSISTNDTYFKKQT
jgi:hypothetical protein